MPPGNRRAVIKRKWVEEMSTGLIWLRIRPYSTVSFSTSGFEPLGSIITQLNQLDGLWRRVMY